MTYCPRCGDKTEPPITGICDACKSDIIELTNQAKEEKEVTDEDE
jgi:NMD protein affecting ribosome stability and mRNA decay